MTERLRQLARAGAIALIVTFAAAASAAAEGVRVGSEAEVTGADGANLRSRPSTSAPVLTLVGEARRVYVRSGPDDGWYEVEYDGDVGWVHGSLLEMARARSTSRGDAAGRRADEAAPTAARATDLRIGSEAQVGSEGGVYLRSGPGTEQPIVELVKDARLVYVVGGPEEADGEPWYKVEFDGSLGWMSGRFLGGAIRSGRVSPGPSRGAAPARAAAPAPANNGEAIARAALALVGSRYTWGGTSPRAGFDCSGLIAYVFGGVGLYPGRTSEDQAGAGFSVTGGTLLPGDIVVFANTYGPGYTHTGIYVGGGQFVHAEDYGTGVRVSSVFSGYWGSHYAGARRAW